MSKRVEDRINELGQLDDDWYLPGAGTKYQTKHLAYGHNIILKLMELGMPEPYIYPIPDELPSLQLEWDTTNGWATSVEIWLDRKLAYFHTCDVEGSSKLSEVTTQVGFFDLSDEEEAKELVELVEAFTNEDD